MSLWKEELKKRINKNYIYCNECGKNGAKFICKGSIVNSYFCGYKCICNRFSKAFNIKIEKIKEEEK